MRKFHILLMNSFISATILLSGCMGTENYYNAQTEYYKAQAEASKAYVQAVSRPVAEMTAPDGTKFVVNNTNIQAPVIHTIDNPIVAGIKTVVNSTPLAIITGGWAVKEIVKHSTNITNNGGTVTTNSNNQPQLANEGNIDNSVDNSATATPTVVNQEKAVIVEQPEPVIVKPEIVETEPLIVRPEIINNIKE